MNSHVCFKLISTSVRISFIQKEKKINLYTKKVFKFIKLVERIVFLKILVFRYNFWFDEFYK